MGNIVYTYTTYFITGNLNKIETNKYKICINKCINV